MSAPPVRLPRDAHLVAGMRRLQVVVENLDMETNTTNTNNCLILGITNIQVTDFGNGVSFL